MRHEIPVETLGAQGEIMARAVESCVHCGFCLAACPTYALLGEEMDSPRGRIVLMKETLEGALALDATLPFIDRCLGCEACEPACPSGVGYGALLAAFRAHAEPRRDRPVRERLARILVHETLPHPRRFRLAATLGRLARPLAKWLPRELATMLALVPDDLPAATRLPGRVAPVGERRARVVLLAGCVQQVLAPEINLATARVLAANGVEVLIPPGQSCCGSLAMHDGERGRALRLAARNLDLFPTDIDAIITNAAGCGSGMRAYGELFAGTASVGRAREIAALTRDVTTFLDELGARPPGPLPKPMSVAYQDACHLAQAQRVTVAPRRLLGAIPNLTLVELADPDLCCGSAGTYNLEQPELARELGLRRARTIIESGADAAASGNIGCLTQLRAALSFLDRPIPMYHTVQLLDMAYRGDT